MSTLLSIDFDNVPDLTLLEPGDYQFSVDSAQLKQSSTGKDMIELILVPVSEPTAQAVYEYLILPAEDDDERKKNGKLRRIKDFTRAFSVPNPNDVATWTGATGWAIVGVQSDPQYGDKNRIQKYVIAASGGSSFGSSEQTAPATGIIPF